MTELATVRSGAAATGAQRLAELGTEFLPAEHRSSMLNSCVYLSIRKHDVRPNAVMSIGLSFIGRLESRVLLTIDAVLASLAAICAMPAPFSVRRVSLPL